MKNKKYYYALGGLILGFALSFFWTRNYNKNGVATAGGISTGSQPQGASAEPGAADQQGMMGSVRETMEKARNNPNDFQAQFNAAKMEFQIGRYPEAIEFLKKAYKIDPKNISAPAGIASIYFDQKNYAEAEVWYRKALEIKPDEPDLLIELGATFIQREPPDPDKAIQSLQFALKINPKDSHALTHLAEAYLLKKDARSAEEALERIKQAEPGNQSISALQAEIQDLKAGRPVTISRD